MATSKKSSTGARTTVRLPERLHRRAKLAAAWSGVKLQEFVACAVEQQLTRVEGEMNEANHRSLPPPKRKTR